MKKIILILMIISIFVFSFTGCQSKAEKEKELLIQKQVAEFNKGIEELKSQIENDNELKLEIVDGFNWNKDGSYTYVFGSVKNNGVKDVSYFKVIVNYLDENDNVLDTSYTIGNQKLYAGDEVEFEVSNEHNDKYKSVSVLIDEIN